MSHLPPTADAADDASHGSDSGSPPRIPGWLKVGGLVVVILLVVVVVGVSLIAGIQHGPGQFGPGMHGPAPSSWRSLAIG